MEICSKCMGRGRIDCPECNGSGKKWHDVLSHGVLRDLPNRCEECDGSGTIVCPDCDGTGEE